MRVPKYLPFSLLIFLLFPQAYSKTSEVNEALFDLSLEELLSLTVNTRKFDEPFRDVPKSLSLITEQEIRSLKLNSIHELTEFIPNLSFRKSFGRTSERPVSRGISNLTGAPVVGILLDGQAIRRISTSLPLYDMQQVEVIKGPEVAYYGRSTFVGAINLIPVKPSFESYTELGIQIAEHNEHDAHILANRKITNDLALLVSARNYEKGNDLDNTLGDTNNGYGAEKSETFSFSGTWTPTEKLELYLRIAHQNDHDGPMPTYLQNSSFNNCYFDTYSQYYCGDLETPSTFGYNHEHEGFELGTIAENDSAHFKAKWLGDDKEIQFVYASNKSDSKSIFDGDLYEKQIGLSDYSEKLKSENFELVSNFNLQNNRRFIIGLSKYELEKDVVIENYRYFGSQLLPLGLERNHDFVDNHSIFMGYAFSFANSIESTIDLRYSIDKIKTHVGTQDLPNLDSNTWRTLSPKFTLSKKINGDSTLIYSSIARSQKPGGFNSQLADLDYVDDDERQRLLKYSNFDEEKLITFETGVRSEIFHKKAWIDANVFLYSWQDLQLTQSLSYQSSNRPSRVSSIINGGKARSLGGEIDLSWEMSENWALKTGIGFADSKLIDTTTSAQEELTGDGSVHGHKTPNWPTVSGHLILNYKRNIKQNLQFFSTSSFTFEDERFVAEHNLARLESTEKFNLSLGIRNNRWSLSLWCKQLNDDQALESASRFIDLANFRRGFGLSMPERRQVGLSFNIKG